MQCWCISLLAVLFAPNLADAAPIESLQAIEQVEHDERELASLLEPALDLSREQVPISSKSVAEAAQAIRTESQPHKHRDFQEMVVAAQRLADTRGPLFAKVESTDLPYKDVLSADSRFDSKGNYKPSYWQKRLGKKDRSVANRQEALDLLARAKEQPKVTDAWAMASFARNFLTQQNPDKTPTYREDLQTAVRDFDQIFHRYIKSLPQPKEPPIKFKMSQCPDAKVHKDAVSELEPLLPNLRTQDFMEGLPITSYRVLPSTAPLMRDLERGTYRRKILVDAGSNVASAKSLLDMYDPFLKFDEVHMYQLNNGYSRSKMFPKEYNDRYTIHYHGDGVDVNSGDPHTDVTEWLKENAKPDDFVALKFDVDQGMQPQSVEWGFLAGLMDSPAAKLVDEIFIELHFNWHMPYVPWGKAFYDHSMQQAFDTMRQLRSCGIAIHAWP